MYTTLFPLIALFGHLAIALPQEAKGALSDFLVRCTLDSHSLTTTACKWAINQTPPDLPGDVVVDETGYIHYPTFRPGAPEERHRLPAGRTYGNCAVDIRLVNNIYAEQSSWEIIDAAAAAVNRRCVGNGGKAGTTQVGVHGDIVISLYSPKPTLTNSSLLRIGNGATVVDD